MITIDAINTTEEQEILSIAQKHGQNAGQLIAAIVRGYLENRHDAQQAEAVLAGIESGESALLDWDDVKAGLYDLKD
ncbi:hypothetical protein U737_09720 [Methylomonas sp. LW13]|uniref:hypothetical protein n=1 Tax=unclassified Methylomonas TaxID=2608980 RepID=UPI00051B0082|nr:MULTISPECIES: hypothetical protein [unclassified Methylomonas]PKD41456.1 hypothetical protein CWO84_04815 [Methylomonas sp. Kb3]QBC27156.1 hypothetical protein U737_09720 [Methylomonas sp. LW13]